MRSGSWSDAVVVNVMRLDCNLKGTSTQGSVMETLSIGDFAVRAGVAPSALRYYERQGLIRAGRTSGNQRRYDRSELRRVAFIKIAQQVGVSLAEIRTPTKADWTRLSAHWRRKLEARITLMQRLRDELTGCIGCGCLSMQ